MSWRASPWLSTADVQSFLDLLPNSWSLERESRHPPAIHKLLYLLLIKDGNGKFQCENVNEGNILFQCQMFSLIFHRPGFRVGFPNRERRRSITTTILLPWLNLVLVVVPAATLGYFGAYMLLISHCIPMKWPQTSYWSIIPSSSNIASPTINLGKWQQFTNLK